MRQTKHTAQRNSDQGGEIRTISYLRRLGYRLTPQRLMVLSSLGNTPAHISAEEIHAQVCRYYPRMPISTVYRVLDLLEALNLVTRTDLGDGRLRYHPSERGHHHHLICETCGKVEELDEGLLSPLRAALLRQYHFQADMRHLAIFGRCQRCQSAEQPSPQPEEA